MIHEGSIRLPFSYAAGAVGSRFLVALRDQQTILGVPCLDCGTVACPPRSYCAVCGGDSVGDLRPVGPGGVLTAWTEVPGRGVVGMIRLDGADTPLIHRLIDGTWTTGDRVRARFATERTGNITDIVGFVPEGEPA